MALIGITSFIPADGDLNENISQVAMMQDTVKQMLVSHSWSVNYVLLSALPNGWNAIISVNGSNSDNMSTVARSFNTTLGRYNITPQNTKAALTATDSTVITGTNPTTGQPTTTTTQTPTGANLNSNNWFDKIAADIGVGTYVLGIAGFAILLIVLVPKDKR